MVNLNGLSDLEKKFTDPKVKAKILLLMKRYDPLFDRYEGFYNIEDKVITRLSKKLVLDKDLNAIEEFFNGGAVKKESSTEGVSNSGYEWGIVPLSALTDDYDGTAGQQTILFSTMKELISEWEISAEELEDFKEILIKERGVMVVKRSDGSSYSILDELVVSDKVGLEEEKNVEIVKDNVVSKTNPQADFDRSIWIPAKQKEAFSRLEWRLDDPTLTEEDLNDFIVDVVWKRKQVGNLLENEKNKYSDLSVEPDHFDMLRKMLKQYHDLEERAAVMAKEILDKN